MSKETVQESIDGQSTQKGSSIEMSAAQRQLVSFLAGGTTVSFFLPWITLFGFKASGFDLVQKAQGLGYLLWAMPVFGGLTLLASLSTARIRSGAAITAAIPFVILAVGIYQESPDLIKVLDIGAYIGLFLAAALMVVATRMKS